MTALGHKYLHIFCPLKEEYAHISSSNFFVTNFPVMFLPKSLTIRPNHPSATAMNWYRHMSDYCSFYGKLITRFTNQSSTHKEDFPSPRPSRTSREGLQCCSCPLLGNVCILRRTTCKPGHSLFFFFF